MRVLVCGSRCWRSYRRVFDRLAELPPGSEVISGGARGADRMAETAADCLGLRHTTFAARWGDLGRRAGVVRNIEMLEAGPELVIAFWDGASRGTANTIGEARRRGIPVEVVGE